MSGSCEVKTCWKVSPEFRIVGEILKKKYEKASKVSQLMGLTFNLLLYFEMDLSIFFF
jgi:hypothetical protein